MHLVPRKSRTPSIMPPAYASSILAIAGTENEFGDRLADAAPGDVITYYVGMLAADRAANSLTLTETRRIELNALADRVLRLAEAGRVHLLQRRVGPDRFAYLATVRPRPPRLDHTQTIRPSKGAATRLSIDGRPGPANGDPLPRHIAA